MAKKKYQATIDFVWSDDTRVDTFLGRKVYLSNEEAWGITEQRWTDDVLLLIKYVLWGGSRGGVKKQWDTWDAWDNINEKNKKKIVKVIANLRGVKFESTIDINQYKLTVEDVELLKEEFEKYRFSVENVKVKVE